MNLVTLARELLTIKQFYPMYLDKKELEDQNIYDVYDEDFDYIMFKREFGEDKEDPCNVVVMVPVSFEHRAMVFFNGKFQFKAPWSQKLHEDCNNKRVSISGWQYE